MKTSNKKHLIIAGSAVVATVAAPSVFADSAQAITDSLATGTALVALVGPGVISIAALMLGVTIVVNWLKR